MTDKPAPTTPFERMNTKIAPSVADEYKGHLLTPRERRMVEAYAREGTYTAASAASGYSVTTVKNKLTKNAAIRKAVGEVVDQSSLLLGLSLERVMQEYARLAFSDIGELVDVIRAAGDSEAALELLAELPADVTAAISSIRYERKYESSSDGSQDYVTGKLELKFWDKKGALNDLGRMLALFKDRVEIEDSSSFGERLNRALQKIEEHTEGE
jgi:phage terminase small subunit